MSYSRCSVLKMRMLLEARSFPFKGTLNNSLGNVIYLGTSVMY